MDRQGDRYLPSREKILGDGIKEVAGDLRLIDASDFVAFIRTEQFANIASLVSSSTELYFRPGTLRFGFSGDIHMGWGETPTIVLDMEFENLGVKIQFRLRLAALHAAVEIDNISFDDASEDPDANTERLAKAITRAGFGERRQPQLRLVQCS